MIESGIRLQSPRAWPSFYFRQLIALLLITLLASSTVDAAQKDYLHGSKQPSASSGASHIFVRHLEIQLSNQRLTSSQTLRQSFYHSLNNSYQPIQLFHHVANSGVVPLTGQRDKNYLLNFTLRSQPGRLTRAEGASSAGRAQKVFSDGHDVHSTVMVPRPNITDKETVVNLAKMTSDAYVGDPSLPGWFNLSDGFNRSQSFGWEKDGLRGHVFANADNSTVVVSFKGTTIGAAFHLNTISNRLIGGTADPRERTRTCDRENNNVLFSCCCATQRADPYWYGSVCDCRNSTYFCNSTCLSQECGRQDRYYTRAMDVILNITSSYPTSQLWTVGHSLGGAVASLMGMTFNVPAVAFESPPDRLPAYRLGLALPPTDYPITYHFGNTADPVFMGACNGYSSSCSVAGYAFESECFTGKRCIYDTIGDKDWHLNILNHRINTVIDQVLETYETVPNCTSDDECVDCFNWYYFH